MAHITQILFSGLGGHSAVAFCLVREFRRAGHACSLLFYGMEPLLPQSAQRCREEGIPYRYVAKSPGVDLRSWARVLGTLREWRPNAVLTHSSTVAPAAWIYRLSSRARWVVRETQANHLKTRREKALTGFSLVFADRVVCLTELYRQQLLDSYGRRFGGKLEVVANPLDLELFRPGPEPAEDGCYRLGMVARLTRIKDLDTLLQALNLARLRLDRPLLFELAGDGDDRARLEALAGRLGLEDTVRFRGVLGEAEIARMLGGLHLYVHATLGETMSTSIMQAMACGLPIVASDVPGVSNLLEQGETALLVPVRQPEALADALVDLLADRSRRRRFGQAVGASSQFEFDAARQARRYLAWLDPGALE